MGGASTDPEEKENMDEKRRPDPIPIQVVFTNITSVCKADVLEVLVT